MTTTFGDVLKQWRGIRRMSQLDLSNVAEVSARHISFLESGRSNPSRPMAMHLAVALDLPRAERNRMLSAAGFSPMWAERSLDDQAMASVRDAMAWTLHRHDPYPAVIVDRHWNVVDRNRAFDAVMAGLGLEGPISFLDEFTQSGSGLRSAIDNWPELGRYMLSRLRTESTALGGDQTLDAAIERLAEDPELRLVRDAPHEPLPPLVTTDIRVGETIASLFSTIAQFGTAEDLALAELRVELFFPADDATRALLEALA